MKLIYREKVLDRQTGQVEVKTFDSDGASCNRREVRIVLSLDCRSFTIGLLPNEVRELQNALQRACMAKDTEKEN